MTGSSEAEMMVPPLRRAVLRVTIGAIAAAAIVILVGILPAEYDRDPTGLGKLLGTSRLWAPEENVVKPAAGSVAAPASRSYPAPFRSDVILVPLAAGGDPDRKDEIEYKVHLEKGGSLVYSWDVPGISNPDEFYTEFHGHTIESGKAMTVAYYRKATGLSDNGVLTVPFSGVHGWYLQNQSEKPVTVKLKLAGFYTLIPAGQPGNEAGIEAQRVE